MEMPETDQLIRLPQVIDHVCAGNADGSPVLSGAGWEGLPFLLGVEILVSECDLMRYEVSGMTRDKSLHLSKTSMASRGKKRSHKKEDALEKAFLAALWRSWSFLDRCEL